MFKSIQWRDEKPHGIYYQEIKSTKHEILLSTILHKLSRNSREWRSSYLHTRLRSLENMQFVSIFSAVCIFCPEGKRCQGGDVSDRAELVLVTARRRTGEHKQRCNQYRHIGATISAIVILQICLIQLSMAFREILSDRRRPQQIQITVTCASQNVPSSSRENHPTEFLSRNIL